LATGSVFERGMRFVVNMILARLLAPKQFGLMALVLAAIGLFEALTEVGVRQSVIQNKQGDTAEFLNVAWWFSGIRGIVLYFVGVIAAPWVAHFYGEPALVPLLRVAFLTMLFSGLTNPALYVLEKKLRFSYYVWIVQGSALTGTGLCLGMAMWIPSVWALVLGVVAQAFLRFLGSFLFCPFRLSLQFDRQSWGELFRFSRGMVGLPILTYLFMQADILFLGRIIDKELLGLYSMALTLATAPQMLFASIAGPMILPVLSEIQDSHERLRSRLLRMTRLLFLFGLPMTTCLTVFSESILTVIYGGRYAQMSGAFSFLCFYVLLYISGTLIASTYMALGRPDIHRWFTIAMAITIVLILYPAIVWFGPAGAAGARLVCLVLASVVQQINLSRLIKLPVLHYIATLKEGVFLAFVVLFPALLVQSMVNSVIVKVGFAVSLCGMTWLFILWKHKDSIGSCFM
jgi:O-antigen/teichoic acid export membrane protein